MTRLPISSETIQDLSRRFQSHAGIYQGKTADNASPLYAFLSLQIAQDPEVLSLLDHADRATQVSNLLFAAVHDLLLGGLQDPLAAYYPDLIPQPKPLTEAYPHFRAFCLRYADRIRELVTTRRVQTNEVQRCACLLPAFGMIAAQSGRSPLALVEIGASAGLNLLWDRYFYDYGPAGKIGDSNSSVILTCTPLGESFPPLPGALPVVTSRVGVDLHPINLFDAASLRWLQALIWPEHIDRTRRLEAATAVARQDPPQVLRGDAVDLFASVAASVPDDVTLCVYHSFTLNQMAKTAREAMLQQFAEVSKRRSFYRVSLEWFDGQEQPQLELFQYEGGSIQSQLLGACESHGRSIRWLLSSIQ